MTIAGAPARAPGISLVSSLRPCIKTKVVGVADMDDFRDV
jgi:hypothetical protein